MAGDYSRVQAIYGMSVMGRQLPTVDPFLVVCKSTTRQVCVQRIIFTPTTFVSASLTFLDSVSGYVIGTIVVPDAAQVGGATGTFTLDWGPTGTKLSVGSHLMLGVTRNGAAGRLHIEAYQKGILPKQPAAYVAPSTAGFTA